MAVSRPRARFLCALFSLLGLLSVAALPAPAQPLKLEALVLPLKVEGLQDEKAGPILQQQALAELSQSFDLKSEQEMLAARDKAIDRIASDECTEEACIKVMGELLDVDYTFTLSVTASGDYWSFTGIRSEPLGRRVRKNLVCEQCTLPKARRVLTELLLGLRPGSAVAGTGEAILILESEPSGLVFVNGLSQGSTPLEVAVPVSGPVDVLIVAEGYTDFAKVYESLQAGEEVVETVRLVRKRARASLVSEPSGAEIWLDGKPLKRPDGSVRVTPDEIRPEYGSHELELKLARYQSFQTRLDVEERDLGTLRYELTPKPGRLVVRVPGKFREADVLREGQVLGGMEGQIARTFSVEAAQLLTLQVVSGTFRSEVQSVTVPPDGSATVSFESFSEAEASTRTPSGWNRDWHLSLWDGSASAGLAYGSITMTFNQDTSDEIQLSYGLTGADLQVGRMALQWMSAEGEMSDATGEAVDSFYYSSDTGIQQVTETNASLVRLLYTANQSGWMGSAGYEQVTLNFQTLRQTETVQMTHPTFDVGYRWNWSRWFLSLRYRMALSFANEWGRQSAFGVIFATGARFGNTP